MPVSMDVVDEGSLPEDEATTADDRSVLEQPEALGADLSGPSIQPASDDTAELDAAAAAVEPMHGAAAQAAGITTTIDEFIASFAKPLETPIIISPPRLRQTRAQRQRDDSELVPKRSARLAAKSRHRATNPEVQARRIMLRRIGAEEEGIGAEEGVNTPDTASYDDYMTTFAPPLPSPTREAMQVLYPGRRRRAC
jgi:hypothetical protein